MTARAGSVWLARLLLVVAVLLLATGLRLHLLGAQSLWHDEGNAHVQATRSLADIADHAARDIHPPGYYWLLALWQRLTGSTEFALRSLSALASVLGIAFAYALGARLWRPGVGLLAALLVTLNTFSIYYAQEARMYALLALWGAASMWALVGLVHAAERVAERVAERKQKRAVVFRWALLLAAFNLAGMLTQYAFAFVLLAQGILFALWLLANLRRMPRITLTTLGLYAGANALALLLYAPWLGTAWTQVTTWPSTGQPVPFGEALGLLLAYLAFGITVGTGTTVAVVFFLLFSVLNLPDARHPVTWWRVLVPVTWVLASVAAFLALDLFREANLKFLLPAQIGFALWLAHGVDVMWRARPRRRIAGSVVRQALIQQIPRLAATLAILWLLAGMWNGIGPLYRDAAYQRDDYRAIAAAIRTAARPGDAIVLAGPGQREVFGYYYDEAAPDALPVYGLPPGLGGDDALTLAETRAIIEQYAQVFAVLWGTDERDPRQVVEGTLDREAFQASSQWYGGVRLVRYATPTTWAVEDQTGARFGPVGGGETIITLEGFALSAREVSPGDVLRLRLDWSADGPLGVPYKVFVQLISAEGLLVAQRDAEPVSGRAPTTIWQPGKVVRDPHGLIVPNDLPPSHYTLIVGLYNPFNPDERLPVNDGDHLNLGLITVR